MDRDAFLSRVRAATESSHLPAPPTSEPIAPQAEGDLVANFVRNLTAVDGIVHTPSRAEDVMPRVMEIMREAGVRSFLSWDEDRLPIRGVPAQLVHAGFSRMDATVPPSAEARHSHQARYAEVDAGLTGASAGFAVSGSIVLTAGPGRPRMASLIPPLHIALLPRAAITTTVSDWVASNLDAFSATSNLVFVTGPSRTGDIEMQLNLGVHGPRTIHVVLVPTSQRLAT